MINYVEKITIQSATITENNLGEQLETWSTKLISGADIRQVSQRESVASGHEAETTRFSFEIRRSPLSVTVSTTDRITTEDGSVWDINAVDLYRFKHLNIVKIEATRRL